MDEGFQFLDIIVLAMIAGLIILRLRSVLGRRTGHDRRPPETFDSDNNGQERDNVINLPSAMENLDAMEKAEPDLDIPLNSPLGRALSQIQRADRGFMPGSFVTGACAAYEMIVEAFGAGDRDSLRPLLSDKVFEQFGDAITSREQAGRTSEARVIEIMSAELDNAQMDGNTAEVTIRFESDLLNVTRDQAGVIVEGNSSDAARVQELWTFSRDTKSRNPNWLLISTQSVA